MFYNAHPKLISGAKTRKVTDKIRATVPEYIATFAKDIKTIESLESPYEDQLIRTYVSTEDITETIQTEKKFKERAEEEERRRKEQIEAQKRKIEEENKKKEKVAKLTKKEAKIESTENIDKLEKIYNIMNEMFKQGKVTEARATDVIKQIKDVVG